MPEIHVGKRIGSLGFPDFCILSDDAIYDSAVDRFLHELPILGASSPNTRRAYTHDLVSWIRYLHAACGKSVWEATTADIAGFRKARRESLGRAIVSAKTWNRQVVAIEKLYRWGCDEGLIERLPFRTRIRRMIQPDGRSIAVEQNQAMERVSDLREVLYLSLSEYRTFQTIGLNAGISGDDRYSRHRTTSRNVAFSDLLVTTGMRLQEAGALLVHEVNRVGESEARARQLAMRLPEGLTKGSKARTVRLSRQVCSDVEDYIRVERANAANKFREAEGWRKLNPIYCRNFSRNTVEVQAESGIWHRLPLDRFKPYDRLRMVLCSGAGAPLEPAVVWLTEVGQPMQLNSWEVAFRRASARCADAGFDVHVHPHKLRHTFAVHMLLLLRARQGPRYVATSLHDYGALTEDPIRILRRLLGHAQVTTTERYIGPANSMRDELPAALAEFTDLIWARRT